MKKLVTTSLLAAAVIMGISACNNGDYNATPKKDNASTINPFDQSLAHKALIGTMEGNIDGKFYVFAGYYEIDPNGVRTMFAQAIDDTIYFKTISIVANDDVFKNKKNENVMATLTYSRYDSLLGRRKTYSAEAQIAIASDQDSKSLGEINSTISKTDPEPADAEDKVAITNMVFYLQKK
jgi:hypothetical protein